MQDRHQAYCKLQWMRCLRQLLKKSKKENILHLN